MLVGAPALHQQSLRLLSPQLLGQSISPPRRSSCPDSWASQIGWAKTVMFIVRKLPKWRHSATHYTKFLLQ
eukprot:1147400-Pelagomonas_calceolata.AAC.3